MSRVRSLPLSELAISAISAPSLWALQTRSWHRPENESIFIPIGSVHRLANPGRIPLEVIEVQTGSYLGEDDIVCLEDVYSEQ